MCFAEKAGQDLQALAKTHIDSANKSNTGISRFLHKAQEMAPNVTRAKLKLLLWAVEHSIAFSTLDDDMFRGALQEFGIEKQFVPSRKQVLFRNLSNI